VLVMKEVKVAFTDKLVARVKALKVGDGMTAGHDIGPLATARQMETVLRYIPLESKRRRCCPAGSV
jgi:acyl-CoA reductase-like NAD-dependent aldehyde dehydrogenase